MSDGQQSGCSVGLHDVAGIDAAQADAAADRRSNSRVIEIHFGRIQIAFVEFDNALILGHGGALCLQRLFRNSMLLESHLVSSQINARVTQQRFVARQLALRLNERGLVRARIDHSK